MNKRLLLILVPLLILSACTAGRASPTEEKPEIAVAEPTEEERVAELNEEPEATDTPGATPSLEMTAEGDAEEESSGVPAAEASSGTTGVDDRPSWLISMTRNWNTDWTLHAIDYDELLGGGPPRDGIPSIDDPRFVSQAEASEWLASNEPVVVLEIDGDARAYPLQILTWHEIVNDTVGGVPVIVTFCPLCNSAVVFERTLDGVVMEFGVSGLLRNSDLVMYDRVTESLWQQVTGQGIVGEMTGAQLTFVPASIVSMEDFSSAFPKGVVLSRETGYTRSYGRNPYAGYDNIGQNPFLFDGIPDERLRAMERVVTVALDGVDIAYSYSLLSELGAINDSQNGQDLVVLHDFGTSSALGAVFIADGEDIGATGVFDPHLDGRKLTFVREDGEIKDLETGSSWDILGRAVSGPLEGEVLTPIVHGDHFWFAWAAFKPDTLIYQPAG
jgi:hypothetical protein